MRRLAMVIISSVLPLLSLAETNDVTGKLYAGSQLILKPENGGGARRMSFIFASGSYTLQTSRPRISDPVVRFYYLVENGDTSRNRGQSELFVSGSGVEKDARTIARKSWKDYVLVGSGSIDPKAKLILWRIELQYNGKVLDFVTNATEQKLKQYMLSSQWWSRQSP